MPAFEAQISKTNGMENGSLAERLLLVLRRVSADSPQSAQFRPSASVRLWRGARNVGLRCRPYNKDIATDLSAFRFWFPAKPLDVIFMIKNLQRLRVTIPFNTSAGRSRAVQGCQFL